MRIVFTQYYWSYGLCSLLKDHYFNNIERCILKFDNMNCNLVSWIRFIKSRKLFIIYGKNLRVTKYKIISNGNRTEWSPIRSVIILVIKQIGLPLRGRPILLITRMNKDRIGLHSVLLPLLSRRTQTYFRRRVVTTGNTSVSTG